jgi:hypothetical protein
VSEGVSEVSMAAGERRGRYTHKEGPVGPFTSSPGVPKPVPRIADTKKGVPPGRAEGPLISSQQKASICRAFEVSLACARKEEQ